MKIVHYSALGIGLYLIRVFKKTFMFMFTSKFPSTV